MLLFEIQTTKYYKYNKSKGIFVIQSYFNDSYEGKKELEWKKGKA